MPTGIIINTISIAAGGMIGAVIGEKSQGMLLDEKDQVLGETYRYRDG